MIDASIPLGVRPFQMEDPANTMAKVMGLKAAMSQDRAAQMQMADAEQARVRRNKMQELLGATPDDQLEGALRKGGFLEESMKIGKDRRDNEKTAAETMKARAEAVAKKLSTYRDTLAGVNDAQTAGRWAAAMYADPDLKGSPVTAVPLESLVSEIPTDPAKFADWKNQFALGASKFIELNKPNTTVRNTGGTTDVLQTPGLGGPAQVVSSVKNTQSPDNAATVGASIENNKRTVGAMLANAGATREVAAATRDAASIKDRRDAEMKVADDWRAQSKGYKEVEDAAARVKSALGSATKSAPATLAAATSFMKLLDPNSVVRESELVMALQASGALDRAMNYFNILQNGKVLTEQQAREFGKITDTLLQAARTQQGKLDTYYRSVAEKNNLRPELVLQDLGQNSGQFRVLGVEK